MIKPPDTLKSDRLLMRRYQITDSPAIFEYASDREVTRYMDWPTHSSVTESNQFVQSTINDWQQGVQFSWAITNKADGMLIGGLGCSCPTHRCSFGYVLRQDVWGFGFATEASSALIEWLSSLEQLKRIWATCDIENPASARVLEKLSLEKEGILRSWSIRPNLPGSPARDSFCYSKTVNTTVISVPNQER